MVHSRIEDKRRESHKAKYPWWWRDYSSVVCESNLFMMEENKIAAYEYEMGRRWLRRVKKKWKILPAYPMLLEPEMNPEDGFAWSLLSDVIFDRITPKIGAFIKPPYLDGKPITRKDVNSYLEMLKYDKGDWVIIQNVAWDLNADWKVVSAKLEWLFNEQMKLKKANHQKRKNKKSPPWERLEIWDCWVANIDVDERYGGEVKRRFGGAEHEKRVSSIKGYAKPHGQLLQQKLDDIFLHEEISQ